eukprot:c17953_g1_i1.p1 GENE.c17953_g1_i1~~c17953_g1_i1.p1  ORF type:complete len:831 (+),score=-35.09 c17953_g1_i1:35-2494(+)
MENGVVVDVGGVDEKERDDDDEFVLVDEVESFISLDEERGSKIKWAKDLGEKQKFRKNDGSQYTSQQVLQEGVGGVGVSTYFFFLRGMIVMTGFITIVYMVILGDYYRNSQYDEDLNDVNEFELAFIKVSLFGIGRQNRVNPFIVLADLIACCVVLLFYYWISWLIKRKESHLLTVTSTTADYSCWVKFLPRDQSMSEAKLKQFFEKYGEVVSVTLVAEMDELFKIREERQKYIRELEREMIKAHHSPQSPRNSVTRIQMRVDSANEKLKLFLQNNQWKSSGSAFVIFKQTQTAKVVKEAYTWSRWLIYWCGDENKKISKNCAIKVVDAPECDDVLYENLHITFIGKIKLQILTILASAFIIGNALVLIAYFNTLDNNNIYIAFTISIGVFFVNILLKFILKQLVAKGGHMQLSHRESTYFLQLFWLTYFIGVFAVAVGNYMGILTETIDNTNPYFDYEYYNFNSTEGIGGNNNSTCCEWSTEARDSLQILFRSFSSSSAIISYSIVVIVSDFFVVLMSYYRIAIHDKITTFLSRRAVTTQEFKELYTPPDFSLPVFHATMYKVVFVSFSVAQLFPLGMITSFIALICLYFIDLNFLINAARTPPHFDAIIAFKAISVIPFVVIIHLILSIFFFAQQGLQYGPNGDTSSLIYLLIYQPKSIFKFVFAGNNYNDDGVKYDEVDGALRIMIFLLSACVIWFIINPLQILSAVFFRPFSLLCGFTKSKRYVSIDDQPFSSETMPTYIPPITIEEILTFKAALTSSPSSSTSSATSTVTKGSTRTSLFNRASSTIASTIPLLTRQFNTVTTSILNKLDKYQKR